MKRCPECRRDYYDETLLYCLDDGAHLLEGPASVDEPATTIMPLESFRRQKRYLSGKWGLRRPVSSGSNLIERNRSRVVLFGVISIVILVGLGYGLYQYTSTRSVSELDRTGGTLKSRRLTGEGNTLSASISPDGKFIAFVTELRNVDDSGQREVSLSVKQIETNSIVELVPAGTFKELGGITFTRDGNFLYFYGRPKSSDRGATYRIPAFGGRPFVVLSSMEAISFSPDGTQMAFVREKDFGDTEIIIANADGSNERSLVGLKGKTYFAVGDRTSWSPDGKLLAAVVVDDQQRPKPTYVPVTVSVANGTVTNIGEKFFTDIGSILWHPKGDALYVVGWRVGEAQGILEIKYPSGEMRPLTQRLILYRTLSITADGTALGAIEESQTGSIWVSGDSDPKNLKQVTSDTGSIGGFSWTPDDRIVYVSDQGGDSEFWIMDKDGGRQEQLTNDRSSRSRPDVSPDGRYIAYAGEGDQIYRINSDGGGPVKLASGGFSPVFSPDGRSIAFSSISDSVGSPAIDQVPVDGGEPRRLIGTWAVYQGFSRDGKFIAYITHGEGKFVVAIAPAEGGAPLKIFDLPVNASAHVNLVWTPDGSSVAYCEPTTGIWLISLNGGSPKKVEMPRQGRTVINGFGYSRDGKYFAASLGKSVSNAVLINNFR